LTLVVIARACDEHGQGSWQSTATLAKKTGKSESQVKRDINRLLELGLLRLGDQTLPERYGVPAHRRPVVYDVALDVVGQKPARAPKRRGNQTTDTGITQKLDGMDATPRGRIHAIQLLGDTRVGGLVAASLGCTSGLLPDHVERHVVHHWPPMCRHPVACRQGLVSEPQQAELQQPVDVAFDL